MATKVRKARVELARTRQLLASLTGAVEQMFEAMDESIERRTTEVKATTAVLRADIGEDGETLAPN